MSSRKSNPRRRSRAGSSTSNNDDESSNANLRVCVRIRPMNHAEQESHSSKNVVRVLNENLMIFDPKEQESPSYFRGRRQKRNIMQKKKRDMQFAFDHVFPENSQQQYVYEHTTKSIVDSLLNGYNCSVFAYGATGAGKTFTMLGAPGHPGITFLTMMELYQRIGEIREEKLCDVRVSYLEVYNENIRDLLVPSGYLAVREDPNKGVVVSGLSLQQPQSAEELLRMLEYGNQNRTQHPTDANAQSSRSHAVFQVFVKQKDRTAGLSTDFRVAKMSLIDLAGSERATVTTNRGARFREGANINRSLLALGNCINALADKKTKSMHIPYRNSKLTRLLKDSLGGNCRTVMIAAISPSSLSYEDTYNTLKYANRAKEIKSNLKRNIVSVDFHVSRYEQIVAELRTEVTELKTKLSGYEAGTLKIAKRRSIEVAGDDELQRLQGELHNVFVQRSSIRKELMELESSDRDLTMKILRKQMTLERVRIVYGQTMQADKTMSKSERVIAASKARQGRLRGRKGEVEQRMKDNEDWLGRVSAEMRLAGKDGQMPEVLQDALRTRHLEIELKDSRRQVKHIKKMARQQDSQITNTEKLVLSLISVVRKQYFLIKGAGLSTSDTDAEFETVQKAVEGDREVVWADQNVSVTDDSNLDGVLTDVKSLIELPILSCVNVTPRAPHLKQRDRERQNTTPSGRHTPSRASQPTTPINPALERVQSQVLLTPHMQLANTVTQATPQASDTNPVTPITRQQPVNILTPNQSSNIPQATPSTAQAIRVPLQPATLTPRANQNVPSHPTPSTKYGPPQRVELPSVGPPMRTPNHTVNGPAPSAVPDANPSVAGMESHQTGATNMKTSVVESSGSPEVVDCKKNLSLEEMDFAEEGVVPLRTPPSAESTSVVATNPAVVDRNLYNSQEATTSSQSGQEVLKQPVARAITFDPQVANVSHQVSPVTGTPMTYAQAVSSPSRDTNALATDPRRKPLGAITNSPQLATATNHTLNESYTIKPAPDRTKTVGFREVSTQPRPVKRRDTFTMSKQGPSRHYRSKSYNHPQSSGGHMERSQSVNTLHKYNLPSMMEQTSGQKKPVPAYMSMTASAANKRRRYGGSSKENNSGNNGSGEQNGFGYSRSGAGRRRETMMNRPSTATMNFGNSRRMSMAPGNQHRR